MSVERTAVSAQLGTPPLWIGKRYNASTSEAMPEGPLVIGYCGRPISMLELVPFRLMTNLEVDRRDCIVTGAPGAESERVWLELGLPLRFQREFEQGLSCPVL